MSTRRNTLGVLAALWPVLAAAAPVTLSNGRVTAEFGDRGLVALSDRATGAVFHFSKDEFGLKFSGQVFEGGAPVRSNEPGRVTYSYASGGYKVDVVYDLGRTWRFVSKQLVVRAAPAKFKLDAVTVFRATVAESVRDVYTLSRARQDLGTHDYGGFLHFDGALGLAVVVQNPFQVMEHVGNDFTVSYAPDMDWDPLWGPFEADRGMLAPYPLSGRRQPERMLAEWRMGQNDAPPGLDEAEVAAFTDMVRAFLIYRPKKPLNFMVGWCANDYQIDVATPEGRTEYKRILDMASKLGAEHVLFAPANTQVAKREDSRDDWGWEYLLWLGMGPKIRANQWDPSTGEIPSSIREMLDYAQSKKLKLVAYVYPVMGFTQNPEWLLGARGTRANLGVHSLQDWLIGALEGFLKHTGISGYAFDHTFLGYEGASKYAQWWGWRRVMETLRRDVPDIVMDGRQAYQLYGPWTWLAGSYPHPTGTDEQPESFVSFPDLKLDRLSADRERYTAYRYRNYEFVPAEIMPGFITHQTGRNDDFGRMPEATTRNGRTLLPFRQRDWDYLGWRYSLLSSIAVAGWNNVLDMIPARDTEEFTNFSAADKAFFKHWLDWARENQEYLRNTKTILGQPAIGKVDGTAAFIGDRGFVFLFNPNARRMEARVELELPPGDYTATELYPLEGRKVDLSERTGSFSLDGTSALVLKIERRSGGLISSAATTGREMPFRHSQQIDTYDATFTGGSVKAHFNVPQRVFDQLAARAKAWPIPWTAEDYRSTWLAPHRLLLYVQLAEPDDSWTATMKIDGRPVDLLKAYASVRANKRNFVGFYADLSLISADRDHSVELELPRGLKAGQYQGMFFENVETEYTSEIVH